MFEPATVKTNSTNSTLGEAAVTATKYVGKASGTNLLGEKTYNLAHLCRVDSAVATLRTGPFFFL